VDSGFLEYWLRAAKRACAILHRRRQAAQPWSDLGSVRGLGQVGVLCCLCTLARSLVRKQVRRKCWSEDAGADGSRVVGWLEGKVARGVVNVRAMGVGEQAATATAGYSVRIAQAPRDITSSALVQMKANLLLTCMINGGR
jgi:hypothetical protein